MGLRMLHPLFRTLVKVVVASLVVGTVMVHFGITVDRLMRETGLSPERIPGIRKTRLRLGLAECSTRLTGDHTDLVCGVSVPPAWQEQQ